MAHPLRIKILEQLFLDGALTATEVAERVGESPANCSWHLRQLAKHGYIEEAPGGVGRQRPWRPVMESRSWRDSSDSPAAAVAAQAMSEVMKNRELEEYRSYQARAHTEPAEWFDAAFWSQCLGWFTAAELHALAEEITRLFLAHVERINDPAARPEGARPVRMVAWGIPATPYDDDRSGS